MGIVLGHEAAFLINRGSVLDPDFVELTYARDVSLKLTKVIVDVTTRGSAGWRRRVGGLKVAAVDVEVLYDSEDDVQAELADGWFNRTALNAAIMDGRGSQPGDITQGLWADWRVFGWRINQNLDDAIKSSFRLEPGPGMKPLWFVSLYNPIGLDDDFWNAIVELGVKA